MAVNAEMAAFLMENVELIESAKSLLDEADGILYANMCKFAKKIIGEQGVFDFCGGEDEFQFARPVWGETEKGEPIMSFWLDCQCNPEDNLWLAVLIGKVPGAMLGLFCWYDWGAQGIKRKEWKSFLREFFQRHPALSENGFSLNEDGTAIIKPLRLDLDCLKNNFASPGDCLEPLANAIDAIASQVKVFDQLAKEAGKLAAE